MIRIISAIKAARSALGWSQPELARRSGVSVVTIARAESGAINPRISTLLALQKSIEDAGVVIQDNSPINGYTLIILPEAIGVSNTNS
jgi:predicted transcriptional regulator